MLKKPNDFLLPRYIGLCGHPTCGKSLVQDILKNNYGVEPVDDGGPLRDIAIRYFGFTRDQVYTQEGKKEFVEFLGRKWQVREFLGELGNRFEDLVGDYAMPFMVCNSLPEGGSYSFGSVRKTQGHFYKQFGGVIIGINNPLAKPSQYAFDRFDESAVDYWIENDALARGLSPYEGRHDLAEKVHNVILKISADREGR